MRKTNKFHISKPPLERAYLVGLHVRGSYPVLSVEQSLLELAMLCDTAGMEVVGQTQQIVNQIDAATFIGSGKAMEVLDALQAYDAQVVVFDDELSPRHQRELEKRFGENIKVIDRSTLILDIFAQHAHTREGSLQVELAQYEYRLPRLTRQWTHLARQAGGAGSRSGNAGVGLRGPGETQLEVDRREIGRKISKLKSDLEQVREHRKRHRQQRAKDRIPVIALAGYTNAGKSTLFRALTGSDVYTADQLFATLDPTTRKLELPSNRNVVLTDTVGFIQKLPTTLIAAFRATLEEITQADVILHVVDLSHRNVYEQFESVEDTLAELDVPPVPRILVGNKCDLLQPEEAEERLRDFVTGQVYTGRVAASAINAENLPALLELIEDALAVTLHKTRLLIPFERGDILPQLFQQATVITQQHSEQGVLVDVELPIELYSRLREFELKEDDGNA